MEGLAEAEGKVPVVAKVTRRRLGGERVGVDEVPDLECSGVPSVRGVESE